MLNAKLSIYTNVWLDLVFNNRNKAYGAFIIRKKANEDLTRALFFGTLVFISGIVLPMIITRQIERDLPTVPADENTVVLEDVQLLTKKENIQLLPISADAGARVKEDKVRFLQPKVVSQQLIVDEMPNLEKLKNASPAPQSVVGDPTAHIYVDDTKAGATDHLGAVTESTDETDLFISVEVDPLFPGGMKAFANYVAKNYRFPSQAKERALKGRVILSFVVERDGSLTHIKILRDLGWGTGEEAVRLLQSSPKWKPGIQNGRAVRVSYSLPIDLQLQ
ncbi:energy transducer TonB [Olivibacter sp. SDN3]|uniref:energy transducer TonB n=1 Tax=Olivibacter sp. SDN3 TaxID=2764720 RepID=UPI0016514FAE|nr:energy transducer TonB [Olivibacter sp. SDN3]QNL48563.1 energy transducer TonB [Olivibacter sp. SDN3]